MEGSSTRNSPLYVKGHGTRPFKYSVHLPLEQVGVEESGERKMVESEQNPRLSLS